MMQRGTVRKRESLHSAHVAEVASAALSSASEVETAKVLPAALMRGRADADAIIEQARVTAEAMVAEARAQAAQTVAAVREEASQVATAKFAAAYVALRAREERAQADDLERTLSLAVLLAERLVGEAIAIEPARLLVLARGALATARGARSGHIEAHPEDAWQLQNLLPEATRALFRIESNPELERGSLVLYTDVGRLDARLPVQLRHLAETLRAALAQ